jgi:biotin synthase
VHRAHHAPDTVQLCTLLSVKTGGCQEDCAYCPQSSKYETEVNAEKMLSVDEVLSKARQARATGSTRFCMGAAWRVVKVGPAFDKGLDFADALHLARSARASGFATFDKRLAKRAKALALTPKVALLG